MKIPETTANVGAYYGNEENGQWQPNGVMIDNGVGGGVVGSGDAGMHRAPVYPVHIPRGVPAGYVMAGAYYGAPYAAVPPPQPDDFADYMWMENEEEFDKQVLQQLEEEALMEQCIEAMLEDEQRERRANRENRHEYPTTSNSNPGRSLEEAVSRSTLNPLAAEFVPTTRAAPPAPTATENKPELAQSEAPSPKEENRTEDTEEKNSRTAVPDDAKTEEAATPPKDPPEVSAADIHKPKKDVKKSDSNEIKDLKDTKKAFKNDPKKKPAVVKSETKVQPKKKEVKPVKSEIRTEDRCDEIEVIKPQSPTEECTPGLKPINYAAAAKASKPKQKSASPPIEKPTVKTDKPKPKPVQEKTKEVKLTKEKLNVQRKNSTK